ncbi:MAG: pyridoxal-5-phosphate-dependent protein subunit beta, partial [Spirochaetota bacterium]
TLLQNGFGGHRIEGIGDKHVPWIHNVRNTDMVIALDDELTIRLMRLFNERVGRDLLVSAGVPEPLVESLDLLGISGIGNMIAAIKMARYYELTGHDIVVTVLTDSMELYASRMHELTDERGTYTANDAIRDHEALMRVGTDSMVELRYPDRKRVHNLKYYTWVEQQGRELEELNRQWYDYHRYWSHERLADRIDDRIRAFNDRVGHRS